MSAANSRFSAFIVAYICDQNGCEPVSAAALADDGQPHPGVPVAAANNCAPHTLSATQRTYTRLSIGSRCLMCTDRALTRPVMAELQGVAIGDQQTSRDFGAGVALIKQHVTPDMIQYVLVHIVIVTAMSSNSYVICEPTVCKLQCCSDC